MKSFAYLTTIDDLDFMQKFIYNAYSSGGGLLDDVANHMTINATDISLINALWNFFLPLAYGLIAIFFLVDIVEKMTSAGGIRELDPKIFIGSLFKLLIAELALSYGKELVSTILELNNYFIDKVIETNFFVAVDAEGNNTDILLEVCADLNLMECLSCLIPALVNNIANAVINVAILLQAISKKLEIIILCAFSGVALSQFFSEGGRSPAVRYIKKFAVCAIHAGTIILIIKITDNLAAASFTKMATSDDWLNQMTGSFDTILRSVLYKFAAIGSISVTKSIINDALGT